MPAPARATRWQRWKRWERFRGRVDQLWPTSRRRPEAQRYRPPRSADLLFRRRGFGQSITTRWSSGAVRIGNRERHRLLLARAGATSRRCGGTSRTGRATAATLVDAGPTDDGGAEGNSWPGGGAAEVTCGSSTIAPLFGHIQGLRIRAQLNANKIPRKRTTLRIASIQ